MQKSILKIKDIIVDESLYPREGINWDSVKEYTECMKLGDVFPDIFIGKWQGKNYLLDGRHRLEAKKLLDEEYINCDIKINFIDKSDMLLAAIRANMVHGTRMTRGDRLKSALLLRDLNCDLDDVQKVTKLTAKELSFVKAGIQNKLILQMRPHNIREKVREKENQKIMNEKDEKELEKFHKAEWQFDTIQNMIGFFKSENLILTDKKIIESIQELKNMINKKFR